MRLGRRLSTGVAEDPPAPTIEPIPAESVRVEVLAEDLANRDQRATEIAAAAAHRELIADR